MAHTGRLEILAENGGFRFRFPDGATEVVVHREGNRIILEPVDEWSDEFLAVLGAWDEGDIPRPSSDASPPRDPFE